MTGDGPRPQKKSCSSFSPGLELLKSSQECEALCRARVPPAHDPHPSECALAGQALRRAPGGPSGRKGPTPSRQLGGSRWEQSPSPWLRPSQPATCCPERPPALASRPPPPKLATRIRPRPCAARGPGSPAASSCCCRCRWPAMGARGVEVGRAQCVWSVALGKEHWGAPGASWTIYRCWRTRLPVSAAAAVAAAAAAAAFRLKGSRILWRGSLAAAGSGLASSAAC